MKRSPLELAALAAAAVPGISPTAVRADLDDPADFDAALLFGDDEQRWRVRSPRHEEASARLESEFAILRAFPAGLRAELPFRIPTVLGCVRRGPLSTFVYTHVAGQSFPLEQLERSGDAAAREVASVLAAIHALPQDVVDRADLPRYSANEFRQRRLNELDQAATSGKIPAELLLRWEHALEDVTLWRFNASVVHGDLHEDNLLFDDGKVTAVTGWTDLHIGDPADDFAWLVASHDTSFVDAVLHHYRDALPGPAGQVPDPHLLRRAALSAEFALAQYLMKGLAKNDAAVIGEAETMLADLASDIRASEAAARELEEAEEAAAEADAAEAAEESARLEREREDDGSGVAPVTGQGAKVTVTSISGTAAAEAAKAPGGEAEDVHEETSPRLSVVPSPSESSADPDADGTAGASEGDGTGAGTVNDNGDSTSISAHEAKGAGAGEPGTPGAPSSEHSSEAEAPAGSEPLNGAPAENAPSPSSEREGEARDAQAGVETTALPVIKHEG
ncbi:macrolide phosphotransferase [Arthrobacter woluwensis]|uniref:phosphotransferase n=1 Tax=Arthrobacter woluwensis TaxID=156980 RepID=UPI002786CC0C|nr:phosphotransferase [Arthrobacter woluwensis]MDQ0709430.1 macrolide phosphotransferase [Arthrobacter woluwensis]